MPSFTVPFEDDSSSGGGGGGISGGSSGGVPLTLTVNGTTPIAAGTIYLNSSPSIVIAYIGCSDPTYAATIKIYRADTSVLVATLGGVAGGLTDRTVNFTAPITGNYDLTFEADNELATALLRGIRWS